MTDARTAVELFRTTFADEPHGVWSAPGRVNVIGEHTDYTGGFVMPMATQQRAFVAVRPRPDRLVRAVAGGRGVAQVSLEEIGPGRPHGWLAYLAGAAVVPSQASGGPQPAIRGWDLALVSDVPVGAGLSSSAAITCAALLAMNDLDGWGVDRACLAGWAQQVENDIVGMPCGIMDPTASLRCTAANVLFVDTRSMDVDQVPWPTAEAGFALLVTDTRAPHRLADGQYASRRRSCEEAAAVMRVDVLRDADLADLDRARPLLSPEQASCARHVITENARVLRTRALLLAGDPRPVGEVLTASHTSLRDDFRVTVAQLDASVDAALEAGAHGARMTGGGFGGCTIALIDPADADSVAAGIDARFEREAFTSPTHFLAVPGAGAAREA